MPKRCARCHKVVDGIPYVADAFVKLMLCDRSASRAASMSLGVHVFGPLLFLPSFVGVELLLPNVMYCNCCPEPFWSVCIFVSSLVSEWYISAKVRKKTITKLQLEIFTRILPICVGVVIIFPISGVTTMPWTLSPLFDDCCPSTSIFPTDISSCIDGLMSTSSVFIVSIIWWWWMMGRDCCCCCCCCGWWIVICCCCCWWGWWITCCTIWWCTCCCCCCWLSWWCCWCCCCCCCCCWWCCCCCCWWWWCCCCCCCWWCSIVRFRWLSSWFIWAVVIIVEFFKPNSLSDVTGEGHVVIIWTCAGEWCEWWRIGLLDDDTVGWCEAATWSRRQMECWMELSNSTIDSDESSDRNVSNFIILAFSVPLIGVESLTFNQWSDKHTTIQFM